MRAPAPAPPPGAEDFIGDRVVFSPRWRTGMRALTLVACVYTGAACLLVDWDPMFGPDHVFSGVRPALKSFVGSLYGNPTTIDAVSSGSGGDGSSGGGGSGGSARGGGDSGGAPAPRAPQR
jgi:uncharacterized membrane protein YgcG